ncbi:MAG TPA: PPK2 family polyphosphate kinase [Pseudonocardiaceae bacterium]|nr:PPK2 family polyphosphate kinase [Pseudonocardiaceae bacterium]
MVTAAVPQVVTFAVEPGSAVDLTAFDPRARPVGPDAKTGAAEELRQFGAELERLQEALYAEGVRGGQRRVLLVLQGMDTSGKGGVIRQVAGLVNPQGLHIASFKKPTEAERQHHFLWRVEREVPQPGRIGVFDRSHYEDVLIARVDELVPGSEWLRRYDEINDFEAGLARAGVTIIKCFLHISPGQQRKRLLARLDNPDKRWKYDPADLDARAKWSAYQDAYAEAISRCNPPHAQWYVVPSDRKWYRNWVIGKLLLETMRELSPRFPSAHFDVEAERARLLADDPLR